MGIRWIFPLWKFKVLANISVLVEGQVNDQNTHLRRRSPGPHPQCQSWWSGLSHCTLGCFWLLWQSLFGLSLFSCMPSLNLSLMCLSILFQFLWYRIMDLFSHALRRSNLGLSVGRGVASQFLSSVCHGLRSFILGGTDIYMDMEVCSNREAEKLSFLQEIDVVTTFMEAISLMYTHCLLAGEFWWSHATRTKLAMIFYTCWARELKRSWNTFVP